MTALAHAGSGTTPLLTVGVPAYNEANNLPRCLTSIRTAVDRTRDPSAVEILVINDGSTDDTEQRAKSLLRPQDRVISQHNAGRAHTCARVIREAAAPAVLLVGAHVELDSGALSWWFDQHKADPDQAAVCNGDVQVEVNSPYAAFWDIITAWGWRAYHLDRRDVRFGPDNFDAYPKGSGMFLAPRTLWLAAYASSGILTEGEGAIVSDDTRLLRAVAAEHPIRLSPAFAGIYFSPRSTFAEFFANARYRGTTFVDGYFDSPSSIGRAVRALPLVALAGTVLCTFAALNRTRPGNGLMGSALVGGALVGSALLAPMIGVAAVSIATKRPPRQQLAAVSLTPAFTLAFGAGLARGYAHRLRRRLSRNAATLTPPTPTPAPPSVGIG